jgi:hypothetical protein
VRFIPASSPFTNHAITGADLLSNLLIGQAGLLGSGHDNLGSHDVRLCGRMSANQTLEIRRLVVSELNWIGWFGSTHIVTSKRASVPTSFRLVKGGTDL